MPRSIFSLAILLGGNSLFANNQINITAIVPVHAETKMKISSFDKNTLRETLYLKSNHQGLTIALSDNSYGSSTLMNYTPLSTTPITFSDDTYSKSTKVAELIISQKENKGSLGVTISVK